MIDEDLTEEKYFCSKNFCGKCLPDDVLIEENSTDVIDFNLLYKYDRSQIEVRELKLKKEFFFSLCDDKSFAFIVVKILSLTMSIFCLSAEKQDEKSLIRD